jgi:hypothetical protein
MRDRQTQTQMERKDKEHLSKREGPIHGERDGIEKHTNKGRHEQWMQSEEEGEKI